MLAGVEDLFAPPDATWQRVSPRLATARRLSALLTLLVLSGVAVAALVVFNLDGWAVVVAVVALALGAWQWWFIGRVVRRWGYAEQAEELYITRGALVRVLVAVPYGRMQYVDVNAGPLDRALGIATVTLHTASPGTTAVIPGLPALEAARLRDRLTELGEARAAGL
ncbi:PH domain-containing protein [Nocardioides sp. HDW12B]|nr:PH domain-containing protein [Nocardioides sp. HDW12B]